jgi:hypothetical protein
VNLIDLQTATRWVATAQTWLEKATTVLQRLHGASTGEARWAVGYYADRLLYASLLNAQALAAVVPDEMVDGALEQARALADQLNRRRLAAKLEQVSGRDGPEADAFLAKASEFRGEVADREASR